jgi:hypothetical protein
VCACENAATEGHPSGIHALAWVCGAARGQTTLCVTHPSQSFGPVSPSLWKTHAVALSSPSRPPSCSTLVESRRAGSRSRGPLRRGEIHFLVKDQRRPGAVRGSERGRRSSVRRSPLATDSDTAGGVRVPAVLILAGRGGSLLVPEPDDPCPLHRDAGELWCLQQIGCDRSVSPPGQASSLPT